MTDPAVATRFAHFAAELSLATLPPEVRTDVPLRLLDILGICVRATELDTSHAASKYARTQSPAGSSTAVGVTAPLAASWAAFVNGVLAHSLDYDDTHLASVLHPSAPVVPAALAMAEHVGATGAELLVAVAAGLEVSVRLGMGGLDTEGRNSAFFEHGQHATSICGAIGSAVASAKLAGLDQCGIESAIGIAASMSSGILESNRNGGTVKRIHCGWAAHAGISAALLSQGGITAAPTSIEGRFGFFQAWLHHDVDQDVLTRDLGEFWHECDIVAKPYPANHFTHPIADTAMRLRRRGVDWREIEAVEIGVAEPVIRTIGEPIDVKRAPQNGYMAQFSAPYVFTAAIMGGGGLGLALEDFSDQLVHDPDRMALMQRVEVVADPDATESFPRRFAARVSVQLRDGSSVVESVDDTRGSRSHPLSYEEIRQKYCDNVDGLLTTTDADAVADAVGRLTHLADVAPTMGLLRSLTAQSVRHV